MALSAVLMRPGGALVSTLGSHPESWFRIPDRMEKKWTVFLYVVTLVHPAE